MSLRYAILGVLDARPMTGYELTRFFESSASWVWSAPQSQIYPLLRRLESEGIIAGEDQVRGERMRRTSYSLTPAGIDDLRSWVAAQRDAAPPRDPFLVQALFFDVIDPADAVDVLERYIDSSRRQAEIWSAHRVRLLARDTPLLAERLRRRDPADHERIAAIKAHVFDALIREAELKVRWAEELIVILGGGGPAGDPDD